MLLCALLSAGTLVSCGGTTGTDAETVQGTTAETAEETVETEILPDLPDVPALPDIPEVRQEEVKEEAVPVKPEPKPAPEPEPAPKPEPEKKKIIEKKVEKTTKYVSPEDIRKSSKRVKRSSKITSAKSTFAPAF